MVMKIGDKVKFTGHGYRRAKEFNYAVLFGEKPHSIKEIRTSCCNTFLVFEDIEGMYNQDFFTKIPPGEGMPFFQ